jgi:hypothetical protein
MFTKVTAMSRVRTAIVKLRARNRAAVQNQSDPLAWPRPQDSVGTSLTKIAGRTYWSTKGAGCAVDQVFQEIWPKLKVHLEANTETTCVLVLWTVYMVGPEPAATVPTVVICCQDDSYRRTAMESISESRILDGYPGFASAHLAEPPDTQGSLVLLMAPLGIGVLLVEAQRGYRTYRLQMSPPQSNLRHQPRLVCQQIRQEGLVPLHRFTVFITERRMKEGGCSGDRYSLSLHLVEQQTRP